MTSDSGPLPSGITYQWNTTGCYTNDKFTGSNPQCFPHGQTAQTVTGNNLDAEDAGTITCIAMINNVRFTSEPFTLRISGKQLMYCVVTCIVYCKQLMHATVLLLATCYRCIIHQLLWFMYRGVFTLGVVVTNGTSVTLANVLTDYSYIDARDGDPNGAVLARCLTGLGPTSTSINANGDLGGLYFKGNMLPNRNESASCGLDVIQPRPGANTAGFINIRQCEPFTTDNEGVYTCAMMNSSMMNQSVRFGVYFNGRSE